MPGSFFGDFRRRYRIGAAGYQQGRHVGLDRLLEASRRRYGRPAFAGPLEPLRKGVPQQGSGGSIANLTGLVAARQMKLAGNMEGAVVYSSDQAHSSNWKNLRILGFQPEQLRLVPVDARHRLDVAALANAIDEDRRSRRRPFCVIATAGTTNTGAVDPLNAIADVCEEQDLWLHVDGAYGAAAVLTARGRTLLRGMERAHSRWVRRAK